MTYAILGQRDPRWSSVLLGHSTSTIGGYGCLLVCFTMMGRVEPPAMNTCLKANGGFSGAYIASFDIRKCAPNIELLGKYPTAVSKWTGPVPDADMARLRAHLATGQPAVIEVDLMPDPDLDQHFVLAVGLDTAGRILVNDPWPRYLNETPPRYGDQVLLGDRYGGTQDSEAVAIWRYWLYEETTPK